MSEYVHLKVHSEYSICDSLVRIDELIDKASELCMPAVALTDVNNLFALVKFYKKALKAGIKPIIGVDLSVAIDDEVSQVTLLCQNQQGYLQLTQLISHAYLQGQKNFNKPVVDWETLTKHSQGLLVLSGGINGDVGKAILANKIDLARARMLAWQRVFADRYYLEIQRIGHAGEAEYLAGATVLAQELKIPVVATNQVCFLQATDFEAHEARVCIQSGNVLGDSKRPKDYTEQQFFRDSATMQELFKDLPSAISNTKEIAKRCNFVLDLSHTHLPNFPLPENVSLENYIERQAVEGLAQRLSSQYKEGLSPQQQQTYDQRLQTELAVINRMGFAGYFLIVADFISWAKQQKIPVGPGRGSGAGSLVAYALGITEPDPLQHELLFERFLNPERVSMPDFDIDFCMERRDEVIDYVAERYGRDAVSQIITFGTMAARAVVRDVGRVLSYPYGFVDKIAKLIPFELGITLAKAMQQEAQLAQRYQDEDEVATLIDLAIKLEGLTRNAGKHAGGVVIAPTKLTDFTPLYCEAGGEHPVTQFDKDDVEAIGLVKFDFLGLRTLTIIDWSLQTVNSRRARENQALININEIPLDDEKTFTLLRSGATTAVFQLESRGMKDLIRRLQLDVFDEIVALVALFRPGPLQSGMVDDFIARKHGREPVHYPHPKIESILKPTYGVILYQEQVMQIAQVLAGYSLGEADLLRRAMGKKKPEEMAKQRAVFMEGAVANGIDAKIAQYIFDLMEKFAGYGFNKSHSAAYALITYQTAWLKAHYPAEFMAAVLSSDMDNTDKVVGFFDECKCLKLTINKPNINHGYYHFTVNDHGQIEYGLGAVKGVGQSVVEHIVAEREANGKFSDLFEFCQRLDLRKITRRALEPLIRCGAFDESGVDRAVLLANINKALLAAEQAHHNRQHGQVDLFSMGGESAGTQLDYEPASPCSEREKLQGEMDSLGLYLSGHPLASYQDELNQFTTAHVATLPNFIGQQAVLAGMLMGVRKLTTRSGRRMAILTIEDLSGRVEVTLFSQLFDEVAVELVNGTIYVVRGKVERDDYSGGARLVAESVKSLECVRAQLAKRLIIVVNEKVQVDNLLSQMPLIIKPYCGGRCPVTISYQGQQANADLQLGEAWQVKPQDDLLEQLRGLCEDTTIAIEY